MSLHGSALATQPSENHPRETQTAAALAKHVCVKTPCMVCLVLSNQPLPDHILVGYLPPAKRAAIQRFVDQLLVLPTEHIHSLEYLLANLVTKYRTEKVVIGPDEDNDIVERRKRPRPQLVYSATDDISA